VHVPADGHLDLGVDAASLGLGDRLEAVVQFPAQPQGSANFGVPPRHGTAMMRHHSGITQPRG
jgi:hypothetical protein